jgi:hypothetical protein
MSTPLFDKIFEHDPTITPPVQLTANDLRDSGMEAVLDNTPVEWKDKLKNRVRGFLRGYTFTIDRVVDDLGGRPDDVHPNSIGAITFSMAKEGLIERTGRMLKAERKSLHRTDMPEWRRL